MKICISAESTIDLPKEVLDEFGIKTVPFTITLGEKMGLDGVTTPEEIFEYVDKTGVLPKTSAVNYAQYNEFFSDLLKEYDEVIHFSLSSDLSVAYQNAVTAAEELGHVHVIDSKSLSTGIALLAIYASKLVKDGLKVDEIIEKVSERIPNDQASFVLATVEYLFKGGRCSSLARLGALLFRIRPQIIVANGKMGPGKKYNGKQLACVEQYCADTLEQFNNPDLEIGFVTHSGATPDMVDAAVKAMKDRGFKRVIVTTAGATISSHCGPKCLGILYINDGGR
ncbi:MAG: DegV family protein [Bacilli bacterium]|nr:DegV family protein [Bacilli bacterium]